MLNIRNEHTLVWTTQFDWTINQSEGDRLKTIYFCVWMETIILAFFRWFYFAASDYVVNLNTWVQNTIIDGAVPKLRNTLEQDEGSKKLLRYFGVGVRVSKKFYN